MYRVKIELLQGCVAIGLVISPYISLKLDKLRFNTEKRELSLAFGLFACLCWGHLSLNSFIYRVVPQSSVNKLINSKFHGRKKAIVNKNRLQEYTGISK